MANITNSVDIISDHSGENYTSVLQKFHDFLSPKTYLEIGTLEGRTLALSKSKSIAIDPEFRIDRDIMEGKTVCHLAQMTSDDFFAKHDPCMMLGDEIDLAFLDGMHWCEFLLRDFINVEKYCKPNSVVILHDCVPTDLHIARRYAHDATLKHASRYPDWWAGDVWKAAAVLKSARPDLSIRAFDAPPTGLVVITNLDPTNRVLGERYFQLVENMRSADAAEGALLRYVEGLGLQSTSSIDSHGKMSSYYWL